jgi:hypothetical protein
MITTISFIVACHPDETWLKWKIAGPDHCPIRRPERCTFWIAAQEELVRNMPV